ncbi:MAG TPA: hypothetical protein VEQ17_04335, partial [Steroidobacteraceae bacterium]|nr:hypothetical protein [Steroidobacteraceae bacterium]
MLRLLLIVHRYLAVAVGLLMALWCLSGFVMLYQDYPQLTRAEQLQGLEPLDLAGCCRSDFLPGDAETLHAFRIEMLAGIPVLRQSGVRLGADKRHRISLRLENALDETYASRVRTGETDGGDDYAYSFLGTPRTLHA